MQYRQALEPKFVLFMGWIICCESLIDNKAATAPHPIRSQHGLTDTLFALSASVLLSQSI